MEAALRAMRSFQAALAHQERHEHELRSLIGGEGAGSFGPQRNRFDQWELLELDRRNRRKAEPLLALPDAAYEARGLSRYIV